MSRTLSTRQSLSLAVGLFTAVFGCSSKPASSDSPAGNMGGASATSGAGAATISGGTSSSAGDASNTGGSGTSSGGMSNLGGASPAGGASTAGTGSAGSSSANLGAATFATGDLDDPSNGGTITMQMIGATGSYPSVRDPASGMCDAYDAMGCCMTKHELTDDMLTPWNEELIMSLRGPMLVKQFVVYQPGAAGADWSVVSSWDERSPGSAKGVVFDGNATKSTTFSGTIGSSCIPNAETDKAFPCGPMSAPYCTPPGAGQHKNYGWDGSKMIIVLAAMPTATSPKYPANTHCDTPTGGWYDAPWFGLSTGELVRAGAFSFCQCYGKDPSNNAPADGCGQFNVFEVVNDNNSYTNLSLFSTDAVDYSGYVGEGPCGSACGTTFPAAADLIDKTTHGEAAQGGITTPTKGPGVAFRRPLNGYRYFITLLDVDQRTIQMAIVHPLKIPAGLAGILPNFPLDIPQSAVDAALAVRLPK